MADVNIKSSYINIKIDRNKINQYFNAVCGNAHSGAKGNIEDMIVLSAHVCPDTEELDVARSALQTIYLSALDGHAKMDDGTAYNPQQDYMTYLQQKQIQQDLNDRMNEQPRNIIKGDKPQ